jgi:hypothetical protein
MRDRAGGAAFLAAPLREAMHEAREAAAVAGLGGKKDFNDLGAGAYAFMQLLGVVAVGWMWLRLAKAALAEADDPFCAAKLVTARHYALRAARERDAAATGRGRRGDADGAAGRGFRAAG